MTESPETQFPPIPGHESGHLRPPRAPAIATAALVCGIIGFCGITSIVGLVLGIIGLRQAKVAGAGSGRAITAIVLSSVWLCSAFVIVILGAIAGPSPSSSPAVSPTSSASIPSADASSSTVEDIPQAIPVPEDPPADEEVPNQAANGLANDSGIDGISFEWVDKPKCGYFDCLQMRVSADSTECLDGLYVEVNLLDSEDTIVGYSNDTVGSLMEGQRALLTFDVTEDNVKSAEVSKFSCH